jgi:glutamyl-tRNA synthetase
VFRNDDLDADRCRPEFTKAAIEDLRSLGLDWDEGPDVGGTYGPYNQSERHEHYLAAWQKLKEAGMIYPCSSSRSEIKAFNQKSIDGNEFLFPPQLRPKETELRLPEEPGNANWRFRTDASEEISFMDRNLGVQKFKIGEDLSDFIIWRKNGYPSYELATVVDEINMCITEIVRGKDLLKSSARQNLIFSALGKTPPAFFHCEIMMDEKGRKLSKSKRSLPRLSFPS